MARISKKSLDPDIEKRMFELFWHSLSQIDSANDEAQFFADLLGKNEQIMLAKRYTIAVLLNEGKNYQQIADTIHVSPSTINSVAGWLKNLKPATRKILDQHLKDEAWTGFFDKIEGLLDSIPVMYTTKGNWQTAGKAQFSRRRARAARSALR